VDPKGPRVPEGNGAIIDTLPKLRKEIRAWQIERNEKEKTVKWQFTTADARIQLHSLYQVI
jgi:hypothetical protein